MKTGQVPQQEITNLPEMISGILERCGHTRPRDWMANLHPDAHSTPDLNIQRFLINRSMRLHLGAVTSENTMDTRYCLVDRGDIGEWLKLFEEGIAPTFVRLNLPLVG